MLSAKELYLKLLDAYGEPRWWSSDPYTVIVQSVLVQNTAWSNVEKTTAIIGEKLTPSYIITLTSEELERMIRPCGFQKAKARTILALTEWFLSFDKNADDSTLRASLLSIKGIGAESADVIMVYAFFRPSFIIDAYTRRFLQRLGYGFSDDSAVRAFFEDGLERDARLYGYCHWLILEHGKAHCRKSPICSGCPFFDVCKAYKGS